MVSNDPRDLLHGNDIRPFTVGVEEEFVLVDPATGLPSLTNTAVVADATNVALQLELSQCQVETCTPVCSNIPELGRELRQARLSVARAAARSGSRPLAVGVPIFGPPPGSMTDTPRYQLMAERFGPLAEQVICGCHVHVCIPDRDLAVQVSNHLRPWLPTLLALTANSPITDGADTGYASRRHVLWARWPSAGPPPHLRSAADYDAAVAKLVEDGHILDTAMVYWDVRLSSHQPTVEIRISDVPATVEETALLACLVRALVITSVAAVNSGRLPAPIDPAHLRAACRCAARDGLSGPQFHTAAGQSRPPPWSIAHLLSYIRPTLEHSGDYEFTRSALARVLGKGNGAVRQREAMRIGGPFGVLEMLSRLTTEGCTASEDRQPA
ncbi:carboxylate-amine ligase [Nocardia carnea]|uniref:carboxylate-amine ligase n=1 Tax=Nocardia carnea TaxID=37328 RepID=UPI002455F76A|nr:glutamate--cysteine ligase [Nocardia carnea]